MTTARYSRLCFGVFSTLIALLFCAPTYGQDSRVFPFVIEQGVPENITNVQTWGEPSVAAGSLGFIEARQGQFFLQGQRKRLLGTNICFGASFASHEKAERLAQSLSRFGIEVVRLHHMDSRDIWGDNYERSTTEIDPKKLERLDYLVYCLEKHGIYVNINLHVSRAFRAVDGFENADQLPTHNKGVDNFDRRMIEFQKKYAKDLLQHVNQYTGKAYVDDPGVAVIEINNENSVVASWRWGELASLPEPYATEFRTLWNDFLKRKYGTTEKLRDAWQAKHFPLGEEMVTEPFAEDFRFNQGKWRAENDAEGQFSAEIVACDAPDASRALRLKLIKQGQVAWRPQFHYSPVTLEQGKPYILTVVARGENGAKFAFDVKENHDPWASLGAQNSITLSGQWQTFQSRFVAPADDDNMRVTINGIPEGTQIEIASVSLREGGDFGIAPEEKLEDNTVPAIMRPSAGGLMGQRASEDFAEFLYELENNYWQEMYQYVKSLGAKQPVTGTQLQYGYWYNQARLDYCDIHAYWNHPNFPRRAWDGQDWLIGNTSLANSPTHGTLTNLASVRVLGRAYTCSEYDHPYPNYYNAEGNLMLAAVASFQDWAATFQFAWSHGDSFERDAVGTFFDMCCNTVKLAHLPACYALFTRGDVANGPGEFIYMKELSESLEQKIMSNSPGGYHGSVGKELDLDASTSLAVYSGLKLTDLDIEQSAKLSQARVIQSWSDLPERCGSPDKKEIVNEFGEIRWNFQTPGRGYFTVDTANSKVFSGFTPEGKTSFDALDVEFGETLLGWATLSLVKGTQARADQEKTGALTPGRYLLTITGHMYNTDAKFVNVGEKDVTTAAHFGGSNGHAPLLCEGVDATVSLKTLKASNVECYALDPRGERKSSVALTQENDGVRIHVDATMQTIWYEIVVK
ncbi:MAG: carbohydrate binding domain-containing protein [Planctomycetia bacterium]|nr:carbohydrate binding domain-containing protein [Planctomycetia bacterium]